MVEDGIVPWTGSEELTPEQDYKAVYFNNTAAGTASVRIKGKGYYAGSRVFEFEILPYDIKNAMVTLDKSEYRYNGTEQTLSVTIQGTSLVKDKDYTVEYKDNVEVGEATVTINGIGSCDGAMTETFTIERGRLSDCRVILPQDEYTYEGNEILPKVKVMNEKNIALAEGKDYTVNYEGNVEATFDIVELPPTPTPTVKPTPAPTDLAPDIKVGNVKRIKVLRKLSKATATWKKVEGAKSYQICYSASKKFTSKKQITVKKNKVLLKKLKSGKTYFLKVRAYKVNGKKKVYGK